MLQEIEQETVVFRPSYDGTKTEPVVLPSRIPNLLINGTTGIAVGMATNIPPHNLSEMCTALIKLLDNPDLSTLQLCRWVKGPDFPTGGHILNSPDELKEIYRTGSGSIRAARDLGIGPDLARQQADLHHEHSVRGRQGELVERRSSRSREPQDAAVRIRLETCRRTMSESSLN